MLMPEISATDASKRFADLLDAVEHRGETFTVVRRGKVVATIAPAPRNTGAELMRVLREHPFDEDWERDMAEFKKFIGNTPDINPWND